MRLAGKQTAVADSVPVRYATISLVKEQMARARVTEHWSSIGPGVRFNLDDKPILVYIRLALKRVFNLTRQQIFPR